MLRRRSRSLRKRPDGVAGRVVSVYYVSGSEKRFAPGRTEVADVSREQRLSDGLSHTLAAVQPLPLRPSVTGPAITLSHAAASPANAPTLSRARAHTVPLTAADDDDDDWRARQMQ